MCTIWSHSPGSWYGWKDVLQLWLKVWEWLLSFASLRFRAKVWLLWALPQIALRVCWNPRSLSSLWALLLYITKAKGASRWKASMRLSPSIGRGKNTGLTIKRSGWVSCYLYLLAQCSAADTFSGLSYLIWKRGTLASVSQHWSVSKCDIWELCLKCICSAGKPCFPG